MNGAKRGRKDNLFSNSEDEGNTRYVTIDLNIPDEKPKGSKGQEPDFESFKFNKSSLKRKTFAEQESPSKEKTPRLNSRQDVGVTTHRIETKITVLDKNSKNLQAPKKETKIEEQKASGSKPKRSNNQSKSKKAKGPTNDENIAELQKLTTTGEVNRKKESQTQDLIEIDEEAELFDLSGGPKKAYIPWWIQEEHVKDKQLRRPSDPDYDPSTLHIPQEVYDSLSPLYKYYWGIKSDYYDTILGMKVGDTYAFYYHDALVFKRFLDYPLRVFRNSYCCYVSESVVYKHAVKLIENGYSLALVEQLSKEKSKDSDLIERQLTQVITRSSFYDNPSPIYENNFIMSIYEEGDYTGVVLTDCMVYEILLMEFKDDPHHSLLRTVMARYQPCEVVFIKEFLHNGTFNMLKGTTANKMKLIKSRYQGTKSTSHIVTELKGRFKNQQGSKFPEFFEELLAIHNASLEEEDATDEENISRNKVFNAVFQALAMTIDYLEHLLIADAVVTASEYRFITVPEDRATSLYLDSQALQNLEVIQSVCLGVVSEENSLFGLMNKTVTPFGKRLLKKWLVSPSADPDIINARLDAIDDLIQKIDVVRNFQSRLAKLPDIEKKISKIYSLIDGKALTVYHYRKSIFTKIFEFLELANNLITAAELVQLFSNSLGELQSTRLSALLTFRGENEVSADKAMFPNYLPIIQQLKDTIVFKDDIPTPAQGTEEEIDKLTNQIDQIKEELNEYIKKIRARFSNNDICYIHIRARYELEIPEFLVEGKKKPEDFVFTSKRKGFQRFHTPFISEKLEKLEEVEKQFKKDLVPFMINYFKSFYKHHAIWRQTVSCLAELDSLCSLATLALSFPVKCRPKFMTPSLGYFNLVDMVHPYLLRQASKEIVTNDTIFEDEERIKLISGPNMGGKSTYLRQTCIAIIMAQVGSYVPASEFELSPIDRIFTRIGATDRILEGKSTFFLELEETLSIVRDSTKNSFFIIDELGRGTSTHDGVALAYAVLKYLAEKCMCRGLFTTHYGLLTEEAAGWENVRCYRMKNEYDPEDEKVTFLYKAEPGIAESHGLYIAKMAGIPTEALQFAKDKIAVMNSEKLISAFNPAKKFESSISLLVELASGI